MVGARILSRSFLTHISRETGAVILKIAYGYNAEPIKNDPLIDMAGDAMNKFGRAAVPGAFLVDVLPFCKCIVPSRQNHLVLSRQIC